MKNKSISIKLRKAYTYERQEDVLKEWYEDWRKDQLLTIIKLRRAAESNDHSEIMHMIDQLQGMTENRFAGLKNVLNILSDPDRELKYAEEFKADAAPEPETWDRPTKAEPIDIDEIVRCYNAQISIREIAARNNINTHKVIKILVTAGVYSSEVYDRIKDLRIAGKADKEIAKLLGLSKSAMNDYTPYVKGIYNIENTSENAKRIRKFRKSNKSN